VKGKILIYGGDGANQVMCMKARAVTGGDHLLIGSFIDCRGSCQNLYVVTIRCGNYFKPIVGVDSEYPIISPLR
jgi:hypothetical protein